MSKFGSEPTAVRTGVRSPSESFPQKPSQLRDVVRTKDLNHRAPQKLPEIFIANLTDSPLSFRPTVMSSVKAKRKSDPKRNSVLKRKANRKPKQLKFAAVPKSQSVFNPLNRTTTASRQRRPISMNQSMHIVLRSDRAKGSLNLRKHAAKIDRLTKHLSASHGVKIYKMANVGNHLHIHLRVTKRLLWKAFISGLTGGIARAVGFTRAKCGTGFWNARPFSRIVFGKGSFARVNDYVELNQLEADGAVPPRSRMRAGASWRRVVELMKDPLA